MCGICGASRDPAGDAVRTMNRALQHRGPDDSGVFVDDESGTSLGAARLSIIDLAGGHQPLANEDGSVVAVLNGEIYNHPSLQEQLRRRGHALATSCDTEVLVHLYEDYGDDLVHALDGMYAFAIWDERRRRLLVARDRFGEKPLFYRHTRDELRFASELKALLAAGGPAQVDTAAMDAYFVLGYVPGPASLIEGVRQLPPGHRLVFEDARLSTEAYWRPPELSHGLATDTGDLLEEVEALLRDSVRSRMVADVPLGVFLSGGTDSTLVASLAAEVSTHAVRTFTVGYDVGEVSETVPARAAAAQLGTEHHEVTLRTDDVEPMVRDVYARLDQPLADQALLASHAVSRFARERVKVVVGGEGADELFAGYPRYGWLDRAARLDGRVPDGLRRAAAGAVSRTPVNGKAKRLAHVIEPVSGAQRHLDWVTDGRPDARSELYGAALRASFSAADVSSAPLGSARDFMLLDQSSWLPDDVLAKADRASMLASLEVRTPFLHPVLAEIAAGVPISRHLQGGGKALLRQVLKRRLPDAVSQRSKVAFRVPAAAWLRGPLAPVLREQVASSRLFDAGYFDRSAVSAAVDEHVAGTRDRTAVLWPVMVLAFWLDHLGVAGVG